MTAARLSRYYPSLPPDERLALMLAASASGDDADHSRLVATAERVSLFEYDSPSLGY